MSIPAEAWSANALHSIHTNVQATVQATLLQLHKKLTIVKWELKLRACQWTGSHHRQNFIG